MNHSGAASRPETGSRQAIAALLAVMLAALIAWVGRMPLLGPGHSAQIAALGMMWLLAAAVVLWWRRLGRAGDLGLARPTGADLAWGAGAGIVLMLLVAALALLSTALSPQSEGVVAVQPTDSLSLLALGVLTAAVCEEVIFRGGVMSALRELGLPNGARVFIQAAAFSLVHLAWPWPHVLFVVFPLALALGALFAWRGNLVTVMLAHLLVDAPLVVVLLLS